MADEAKPDMRQDASTGQIVPVDTNAKVPSSKDGKAMMSIRVYAPFRVYFEGQAYSISAVNATGPFDILPHHHNFLCMLVPCELVIKTEFDTKRIKIARALMHVKAERVTVFVDV